jgi:hypothetical protein
LEKFLHIVSFDVPYPPNYGGVIDVFYKLVNLHKAGVKIILHCMEYGRGAQKELDKYCHKVYYYKRNTSFINQLSSVPYIVKSRSSKELLDNLLLDGHPILFEGLHSCYYLSHEKLAGRQKIYRESNIEHHYYYHLAHAETNGLKKFYFVTEARKLFSFQKQLSYADLMLVVSASDQEYLQHEFPTKKIEYLPSFHPYNEIKCKTGKGNFVLYHGNLSVSENSKAAEFLIKEVFSKTPYPVIIAGLNPSPQLIKLAAPFGNISIITSPDETEMEQLLQNAHVHCLYTHQATGLKLKLLNVLYSGRFCICNDNMLEGTNLREACLVRNEPQDIIQAIDQCFHTEFTEQQIEERKKYLVPFDNQSKSEKLIAYLGK